MYWTHYHTYGIILQYGIIYLKNAMNISMESELAYLLETYITCTVNETADLSLIVNWSKH